MGHTFRVEATRRHGGRAGLLDCRVGWAHPRPGVYDTRRRHSQEEPGTPRCRRASPEAHLGQQSVKPSGTASARRMPTTLGVHCMEAVAQPPTTFRLTPRPYQYEAVAALLAATARGVQRPLLVLPTGTGKTIVFALLVQRRRGRSLILAHRDELIQQAVDKLRLVDPTLPLGVVQAARDEHTAPTVVASVQTLSRRTRLTRLVPDFQTIVIDEAHHAPAPTYRRILEYCRAWHPDGPLVVGVTATPERGDHHSLRQVFDRIVYQKTLLEMMQAGYLVDLRALQVLLQADFDALRTQQGDFVEAELESLLLAANAPAQVLAAFQTHAADRKALLFTPTVALAYAMAETFRAAGIAAEALDGTTPLATRRAILQRLHAGETRVVANCAVLTEGFDEPSVNCIIVARPTQSAPLYQQMLGRGTRTYPGKTDCLVLDVVGVSTHHTLHTAATLFACDAERLARQSVLEILERPVRQDQDEDTLLAGTLRSTPVDLFARRALRWVQTRQGAWVLSLGAQHGTLRLRPDGPETWQVVQVRRDAEPVQLGDTLPLPYAQGLAEDYARHLGVARLVEAEAPWRQHPATEKQTALLRKLGITAQAGLTKGEAAELLAAVLGDWD
jgi:superfamily II DNA or RNA helicase